MTENPQVVNLTYLPVKAETGKTGFESQIEGGGTKRAADFDLM